MSDNEKAATAKLRLSRDSVSTDHIPSAQQPTQHYKSHRDLLKRDQAVWKRGSVVHYSTAGDNPQIGTLRCLSGSDAKRIGGSLLRELLTAQTDKQYNDRIVLFLKEITDAWPANEQREQHVHECRDEVPGNLRVDGTCGCGFDWKKHQLTQECGCGVRVDEQTDTAGKFVFVIHRQVVREVVTVQ